MALEFYRTAFQRLQFQDEYLFKITGAFLTLHGALATLAGWAAFQAKPPHYVFFLIAGVLGGVLSVVWWFWIDQNDYWHSVWIGVLRKLEAEELHPRARVVSVNLAEMVRGRGQADESQVEDRQARRGHKIAKAMPWIVGLAWIVGLVLAVMAIFSGSKQ